MFGTLIDTLLGTVPEGGEVLRYLFSGVLALVFVRSILGVFGFVRGLLR